MNTNLGIITSGGGLTCSYSVGALLALIKKYNLTTPKIAIGISGGAGTLSYYVSGQYESIRNIWENLLYTRKFLSPLRFWKIINIDYLIDEVFKKQDPLILERIYDSFIDFQIPCTNIDTGKVEYFSNKSNVDFFEVLRATKAMPLAYGKTVYINGQEYCDTYLSSCIKLNIEKAKSLGAEKILVLDNSSYNPVIKNGLDLWINSRSNQFKKNYFQELNRINHINDDIYKNVFFIKPKGKLKISTLNNNQDLLKTTIQQGLDETTDNSELESFLK